MKTLIITTVKSANFDLKAFDKEANMVPSIVSLICVLRKFYTNGKNIADLLDVKSGKCNEDFRDAVSDYYSL